MKGKVTCTCGWSWNKSDSSKKDMYICHECGRDNSNNMKNGGWMDNYNDYKVSAPEGMVGDGFSNVGRNYSPAWGGQFQNGGPVKPSQKNYKTQGQYKAALREYELNSRKYKLNNNPEKLKGESDKDYENRTKYFDFKVRQEEDKYPVSKAYLEMKDDQNADPNIVKRTLRQIATAPIHVGYGIYNAANPHNLDKYKSRATKNNEDLDLINSSLDVASLLVPFDYGMKASPLWKQAAKRTAKEVAEDEGFNLLKAGNKWINSFQMGGSVYPVNYVPQAQGGMSMPGAVGFTYARTNDPAPSEGPYAKKTMASAQNGGWLDGYDEAQTGKRVLPNNDRALQILANIQKRKQGKGEPSTQFSNVKIKDERGEAVKKVDNTRTASKPKFTDLKKTNVRNKTKAELAEQERINDEAIIADRKARMADSMKAQNEDIIGNPNWKEVLARETQSTGDKFRLFPNDPDSFIDDWLNPGVMIGDMASSLGAAPYDMEQQESMMPLMTAIGVPLLTGGLEGIGAKTNRQFINNLVNPVNMVPGYKSAEKFITPKIKKTLAKGALPILEGAQSVKNKVYNKAFDLASSYRANNKNIMQKAIEDVNAGNAWSRQWYSNPQIQNRYDEWITPANKFIDPKTALFHSNIENMYPGMSSINLDKSIGNRLSGTVARNNLEKLITEGGFTKPVTSFGSERGMLGRYSHTPNDALVNIAHPGFNKGIFGKGFDVGNTVVHENIHALTKGDYGFKPEYLQKFKEPFKGLSDLTKHQKYLIKPTEVHARIGELRRTFGLTPETVVDDKLMNHIINQGLKGKTSVQKDFFKLIKDKNSFKQLMNTAPAGVIGVGLGANALQQKKEGGVIKDDRGQWEHPGEITEINSPYITMQGVPYDVLGISDTGDTKLMKPGGRYKYKGKKVTEYPMAKNGLRQEQKGLVNLDQLTNFTNYNKPQPGGWLSKYE